MKRRVRKIANFFAFNLLFFALYLNFIHRDKAIAATGTTVNASAEAFSGTTIVDNTNPVQEKKTEPSVAVVGKTQKETAKSTDNSALRLSIN
ncbi:MAG TPA: hypothetical protein PLU11_07950 [Chitinophagaceae bacterium]|nr:hypothetical protein [Chitinophagaceae bacterium]HPN59089.1 hypothetical protein [Chitinophagaceae bacterium]